MTATYYILFVITAIAAVVFLAAAVVMFFLFNIPKIVGHLTGYTAKKQIKLLQSKSVAVNSNRSEANNTLNEFMQQQRNIAQQVKKDETETVNLPTGRMTQTAVNMPKQIPSPAVTDSASAIQPAEKTNSTLKPKKNYTENLHPTEETMPLQTEETVTEEMLYKFEIILSMDFVNTDEII